METPDGVYNMVQSYRQTFPLNADNVTLALAEALAVAAPKESRPQGRPPENGAPMRQYMVSLTEAMAQAASDVGAGSISRGVRRMVQEYMNAHR